MGHTCPTPPPPPPPPNLDLKASQILWKNSSVRDLWTLSRLWAPVDGVKGQGWREPLAAASPNGVGRRRT